MSGGEPARLELYQRLVTRLLFFAMIGAVFTAASLAFAAVHLG